MGELALSGVTVVDLTQIVSGAVTSMMLADFGAEVIKVEPVGGETYRHAGYELHGPGGSTNLNILRFSRGKKSVEIDLKTERGKELLTGLVAQADVLVENFRPGVLARLGFSWDRLHEINSRLVYTSISGFGHDDVLPSPYRDRPAYAIIAEAMAGLTHLAGEADRPPAWMGFAMSDIFTGTCAFAGTLVALRDRDRTGQGTRVDLGMFDASVLMNDLPMAYQEHVGETMGRGQYALQSPWGPFATNDGYVIIAVLNAREWANLCAVIDRPDLATHPDLITGHQRSQAHEALVRPAVEAWTSARSRTEAVGALQSAGVPSAPVNTTADLASDPQVAARGMQQPTVTRELGEIRTVGNPIKVASSLVGQGPATLPGLGEHTDEVLRDRLGLDEQAIAGLREEKVVG
ncbi:CaiB/BaiF CoA transferase family protein [Actinomycetospora termitidis]|uniref:CoA transferase n=1 Tax=Actinomycetospora termitidis TaxID=3053470 RepID=A0ABT7MJX4_9PSEU|nr:CoA transferase [Actinomycetospora sp. Odt1-22]MDL5159658.1 CoA transferase [Actinomycetospora sp. Odt1-22]